jgi:Leucine-rich repeat (LRR) protein
VYEYCSWYGIQCQGGQIYTIDLTNNNLTGTLPGKLFTLENSTNIIKLSFANNKLTGNIPAEIAALPKIQSLDLKHNQFTGSIPATFFNTTATYIDLNSNNLSGKITEFSSVLQTVDLSHNTLAGDISNLFCAQTDLRYLGLANNTFTGSLPSCISKMRNIQQLLLNNNKLTSIPEIARPQSLYSNNCLLQNNNFECPIPQWTQDYCKATCSL